MDKATDNSRFNVQNPDDWTLSLRLHADSLQLTVDDGNGSLMADTIALPDGTSYAQRLESAVYANEFLLQQFGKTIVVTDSDRFLLIPDEMAGNDAEECQRYYDFIYPDDNRNVLCNHIDEANLALAFSLDREVESFVRRTFFNPPVLHTLTPLITYFKRNAKAGGRNQMIVVFAGKTVEIVVLKSGRLAFANVFPADYADNAYYYIVNAWRHCGMSDADDEMLLAGDAEMRSQLTPRLVQSLKGASTLVYPSTLLERGSDAMKASFDLLILPLCE